MKKLSERFAAWRRRLRMACLIEDRQYAEAEMLAVRSKIKMIDQRMQELIARDSGKLPNVPANDWQTVRP